MQDKFNNMQEKFIPQEFKDKKGLINMVLHVDKLITPKIINIVYLLLLIILAIGFIFMVLMGIKAILSGSIIGGLISIVLAPIFTIIYWLVIRISVEMTIIAFKNTAYLKKISEK